MKKIIINATLLFTASLVLNITCKIVEDETHLSVVPAASSRTLKVLYSQ